MLAVSESYSPAIEDYVKAIYHLAESGPVTMTALSRRLSVSQSSASGMLRRLDSLGLVHHARYSAVELTGRGRRLALDVIRRHRLVELYLVEALGFTWDEVHDEAEQIEHVISRRLLDRIDDQLGNPTHDPHGDPIPDRDGSLPAEPTRRLSGLPVGAVAQVARVSDADPGLLRYLAELGISLGDRIEVAGQEPFGGPLLVRVGPDGRQRTHALGQQVTNAISVAPE